MPEYSDSNPSPWGLSDDLANRRRCVICHAPKGFDPVAGWCRACGSEPPAEEPAVEAGAATPTDPPNMPEEALRWARAGIAVFPVYEAILGPAVVRCACDNVKCANIGKHPRTANGFHDATTDENQVRAWWTKWPNANIGAPTGNGLFVVDLDGPEAEAWLRERVAEHGPLPATCEIMTGRPEGGRHLYFRGDGVKNSTSKIGPKVDARGEGGYVILPPSLHLSGRRYGVSVDAPVAEAPGWLLEAALNATSKPKGKLAPSQGDPGPGGGAGESRKRLDGLVRVVEGKIASAPEGTRNDTLNREAFCVGQYLGHYRIDLGEYERRLVNAGIAAGLPACEAEATVCGANGRPGSLAQGYADPKPLPERSVFAGSAGSAEGVEGDDPAPAGWQAPIPFDDVAPDPLPLDAFPKVFGRWLEAYAETTQVPADIPAAMLLGAAAGAIHGKYEIRGPAHREPVCLWTMAVHPPGGRKSESMRPFLHAYNEREMNLRLQAEALQAEVDKLEQAIESADDGADLTEQRARLHELRRWRKSRVYTNDCTPERLAQLMADNGGAITILAPEGATLFRLALGHYGKGSNLDVYLQGHAGEPIRVDRKPAADGRQTEVRVGRSALSVAITVQPHTITEHTGGEIRERGFLARFLPVWPHDLVGFRKYRGVPTIPADLQIAAEADLRKLFDLPGQVDDHGEWVPNTIKLSIAASERWLDWAETVEEQIRPGRTLEDLPDFGSKLPGATLRIAAVLHALASPVVDPAAREVSAETMRNAVRLAGAFIPHAVRVYRAAGLVDGARTRAARILRWARRERVARFTARDCFTANKHKGEGMDDFEPAFRVLVHHHYVRACVTPPHTGPGRPPSTLYEVNPSAFPTP